MGWQKRVRMMMMVEVRGTARGLKRSSERRRLFCCWLWLDSTLNCVNCDYEKLTWKDSFRSSYNWHDVQKQSPFWSLQHVQFQWGNSSGKQVGRHFAVQLFLTLQRPRNFVGLCRGSHAISGCAARAMRRWKICGLQKLCPELDWYIPKFVETLFQCRKFCDFSPSSSQPKTIGNSQVSVIVMWQLRNSVGLHWIA